MSDTFLAERSSAESAEPRLLYEIRQNLLVVYRLTSGDRDIEWGGYTWTAEPIASSEIGESTNTADYEVTLTLPIRHVYVQRYLAKGSPPKLTSITIYEFQAGLETAEHVWVGNVTGISCNMKDHTASLQIPSRLTNSLERMVSAVTAGVECPHILYGPDCRLPDTGYRTLTTLVSIDGRRIRVASLGDFPGSTGFRYINGDCTHVATGESQTIFNQLGDGATMDLQAPMPDAHIGDAVVVRLGCKHDIAACLFFQNTANYGGEPQLPVVDLFIPGNSTGIFGR